MRAGAHALLMATDPIKRGILRWAMERPLFVDGGEYRITDGGREALFVAFIVERWLQAAPHGPVQFDSDAGEAAVAAFAEAWSSTVVHMLAREPMTLHELDRAIEEVPRGELGEQVEGLRLVGGLDANPDAGAGAIYSVTDWLRAGLAPLATAARLERRAPLEEMAPIDGLDVEAAFLLTLPLLELPRELSGSCRLGVKLEEDASATLTGVTARIEQGRIVSCAAGLEPGTDAWAAATAGAWLDTVIEPDAELVRTGGDRWLVEALLERLHEELFGVPVR